MGTAATETVYTGTFHGTADQVSPVRRAVARHLGNCLVTDDAVLIASDSQPTRSCIAGRAGSLLRSAWNCTAITCEWSAVTPVGHGETGGKMTDPTD